MDIAKLDKNLAVSAGERENGMVYHNVLDAPFDLYGFFTPQKTREFLRMPKGIANTVSEAVAALSRRTAGGRVRFCTDSQNIAIEAKMPHISRMPHMPLMGSAGFDLYEKGRYLGSFVPPVDMQDGYHSVIHLGKRAMRDLTINFPLYSEVEQLLVGLDKDAALLCGERYQNDHPVLFYGSSITQGGCASRPGTSYPALISQAYNLDYVNLGFAGNCLGEPQMANYIAEQPLSLYVSDYDHNAPSAAHLEETLRAFYKVLRKKKPQLPILFVTRPDYGLDASVAIKRCAAVKQIYQKAQQAGDNAVYFLDGYTLFDLAYRSASTVDGVHPNDFGFVHMAKRIGAEIAHILQLTQCGHL